MNNKICSEDFNEENIKHIKQQIENNESTVPEKVFRVFEVNRGGDAKVHISKKSRKICVKALLK